MTALRKVQYAPSPLLLIRLRTRVIYSVPSMSSQRFSQRSDDFLGLSLSASSQDDFAFSDYAHTQDASYDTQGSQFDSDSLSLGSESASLASQQSDLGELRGDLDRLAFDEDFDDDDDETSGVPQKLPEHACVCAVRLACALALPRLLSPSISIIHEFYHYYNP